MVYFLPSVLTYYLSKFSEHTTSSTRLLHGLATSKLWLMFFWHPKNSHKHENSRRLKENNIVFKSSSGCSTLFQFAVPYTSDQEACVTKSWTKDMGCQMLPSGNCWWMRCYTHRWLWHAMLKFHSICYCYTVSIHWYQMEFDSWCFNKIFLLESHYHLFSHPYIS